MIKTIFKSLLLMSVLSSCAFAQTSILTYPSRTPALTDRFYVVIPPGGVASQRNSSLQEIFDGAGVNLVAEATPVSGDYVILYDVSTNTAKRVLLSDLTKGLSSFPGLFTVVDTVSTSPRGILSSQISTDTNGARVGFAKARGTAGALTTVATGDTLGRLMFRGYDGENYLEMASIEAGASGTIAATRVPTFLAFSTATNAVPSVLTERMRIDNTGLVTIPTGSIAMLNGITSPVSGISIGTSDLGMGRTLVANQRVISVLGDGSTINARGFIQLGSACPQANINGSTVNPTRIGTLDAVITTQTALEGVVGTLDFAADGSGGVNGFGAKLKFHVKEDNAANFRLAGVIRQTGFWGINTEAPLFRFHVIETDAIPVRFDRITTSITNNVVSTSESMVTTTGNMADGFGPQTNALIKDEAGVENYLGSTAFVRNGADDTGAYIVKTTIAGNFGERIRVTGNGLRIGGGTDINKVMSNTATLDFGVTAAGAVSDLTITVTGAVDGDIVTLGVPNGSVTATGTYFGWVSAANTVTIRFTDNALAGTEDPASGTFRATVTHF